MTFFHHEKMSSRAEGGAGDIVVIVVVFSGHDDGKCRVRALLKEDGMCQGRGRGR